MNKELAAKIMQDMQNVSLKRQEAVHLRPIENGDVPVPLSPRHFVSLHPQPTDKIQIFIDGGNAEIIKTPDYSLQFVRFAAVGFVETKKVLQIKKEGYLLVAAQQIEGKLCYTTQCYGGLESAKKLTIAADDPLLATTADNTQLGIVAGLFRALHEIHFAQEVMQKKSIMVFDRAMHAENEYEKRAFDALYGKAALDDGIICGVNKTTALLCNNGESIVTALLRFDHNGAWLYAPVFADQGMGFVRLHPMAKHIFRFAVHQKEKMRDVANVLMLGANDAVFLGYPYGLIAADRFARVSNREKEYLQTMFFSLMGQNGLALEALDAHAILDSIG